MIPIQFLLLPCLVFLIAYLLSKKVIVAGISAIMVTFSFPSALFMVKFMNFNVICSILFVIQIIGKKHVKDYVSQQYKHILLIAMLLYFFNILICTHNGVLSGVKTYIGCIAIYLIAYAISLCVNTKKDIKLIFNFALFMALVSSIYSIFCYYVIGFNPFTLFLQSVMDYAEDYNDSERGFLLGRAQGFLTHPLHFAGMLICSVFIGIAQFLSSTNKIYKLALVTTLLVIVTAMFLSGCRSAIASLIMGTFLYLFLRFRKNWLLYGIIVIICFSFADIDTLVSKNDYLYSIVHIADKDQDDMGGSSVEMRINQLQGTVDIVTNNPITMLFGNGVNWCSLYSEKHGMHPVLMGFESILFKWPIEFGIVGFILLLFVNYYKPFKIYNIMRVDNSLNSLIVASIASFLLFGIMTGHYAVDMFIVTMACLVRYNNLSHSS